MEYNIHPLVVHFPIALLIIYSLIKIFPVEKWLPNFAWKDVRKVLIFFGFLGGLGALSSGEIAQELSNPRKEIVEMHELFANMSMWFYGILLAGEFLPFVQDNIISKINLDFLTKILIKVEQIINIKIISILLAILALGSIAITGMLGGVMVYGLSADPLAPFVLKILGIEI